MSKTWVTGDIINATDMNRIEGGVLPTVMITKSGNTFECDKSIDELRAMFTTPCVCLVNYVDHQTLGLGAFAEEFGAMVQELSFEIDDAQLSFVGCQYTIALDGTVTRDDVRNWTINS